MYNLEIKKAEKIFLVSASGTITQEEGSALIADLKKKFSTINTNEYSLVLDTEKLKASSTDSLNGMQTVQQLYLNTPFKGRFLIASKSAITKMQLNRVNKDSMNLYKPIESLAEITSK